MCVTEKNSVAVLIVAQKPYSLKSLLGDRLTVEG